MHVNLPDVFPRLGFTWRLPWRRFSAPMKVSGGKVCGLGKPAWHTARIISGGANRGRVPVGVGLACPNWKPPVLIQSGLEGGDTSESRNRIRIGWIRIIKAMMRKISRQNLQANWLLLCSWVTKGTSVRDLPTRRCRRS
jgi:hypothetical protein